MIISVRLGESGVARLENAGENCALTIYALAEGDGAQGRTPLVEALITNAEMVELGLALQTIYDLMEGDE